MPRLNKLTIIGHAGADSEIRSIPSGKRVWTCRMALSHGANKPPTWVGVNFFEPEKLPGYLDALLSIKKGDAFFADGQLEAREWTDKQGGKHTSVECKAFEVYRIDHQRSEQQPAPPAAQHREVHTSNADIPF